MVGQIDQNKLIFTSPKSFNRLTGDLTPLLEIAKKYKRNRSDSSKTELTDNLELNSGRLPKKATMLYVEKHDKGGEIPTITQETVAQRAPPAASRGGGAA